MPGHARPHSQSINQLIVVAVTREFAPLHRAGCEAYQAPPPAISVPPTLREGGTVVSVRLP